MVQTFTLPTGRVIEYLISGNPTGFPLVFIHGTPGACIPNPALLELCEQKGMKLITLSRAGYGGSTRNPGRSVADYVDDVQALNEHLGVTKCVVGGWSGGGPHALACAARLPGCLATLCVAGIAPFGVEGFDWFSGMGNDNVEEFGAAIKSEADITTFCNTQRPSLLEADLAGLTAAFDTLFPPVDKNSMADNPAQSQNVVETFQEALRVSADGWIDDDLAFVKPWGFELSEIKTPVFLYQGSEDRMVPFAHGVWLGKNLPKEVLVSHLVEGEGHVSIFVGGVEGMVEKLLEVVSKA